MITCVLCLGAGWWDRRTGTPIYTKPPPKDAQKCPYCEGSGKVKDIKL